MPVRFQASTLPANELLLMLSRRSAANSPSAGVYSWPLRGTGRAEQGDGAEAGLRRGEVGLEHWSSSAAPRKQSASRQGVCHLPLLTSSGSQAGRLGPHRTAHNSRVSSPQGVVRQ